jgi:hypothetical protein
MKRLIFSILVLSIYTNCFSQITSIPLKISEGQIEGSIYTLPKTIFLVEVETKCIKETPGKYYQYAERFLGLSDVCQSEKIRYEITSVKMTLKSIPDNQNSYILINKKNKLSDNSVELTKEGFLKSINGPKSEEEKPVNFNSNKNEIIPESFQTMETSIITKEMQQSTSTAKIAELAAAELFNIRDTRINILTQDVDKTPSDGRSYEIVLSELNRLERYYTELFTGKREEKNETSSFQIEPMGDSESIIFRFSEAKGVIDKSDLSGVPVYLKIKKNPGLSVNSNKGKKENPVSLYYRLPGNANVKITDGVQSFYDKDVTVAQFGTVLTLPQDKYSSLELCPFTGALIKVSK